MPQVVAGEDRVASAWVLHAVAGEEPEVACLVVGNRFETCWVALLRGLVRLAAGRWDHVEARSEAPAVVRLVAVPSLVLLVAGRAVGRAAVQVVGQVEAWAAPVASRVPLLHQPTDHGARALPAF